MGSFLAGLILGIWIGIVIMAIRVTHRLRRLAGQAPKEKPDANL